MNKKPDPYSKNLYFSELLEVYQNGPMRHLRFKGGLDQTLLNTELPHKPQMLYLEAIQKLLRLVPDLEEVLILGLGGGAILHLFNHYYPQTKLTVVEKYSEVIEVAKNYFYCKDIRNIQFICSDAKEFLKLNSKAFSLIVVDIFDVRPKTNEALVSQILPLINCNIKKEGFGFINYASFSFAQITKFIDYFSKLHLQKSVIFSLETTQNLIAVFAQDSRVWNNFLKKGLTENTFNLNHPHPLYGKIAKLIRARS